MAVEEHDPVSGRSTTGHEWNGIKELDTPIPRGVLIFLILTHVFAVLWWMLMPTWPLGTTYTKGLLEVDQRRTVEAQLVDAATRRENWTDRIEASSFDEIQADDQLMAIVRSTGHRLFGDNCAACHGIDGRGGPGFPNLTAGSWLWGGDVDTVAETIRVGINSEHPESRFGEMPAFGRDGILDRDQVREVAAYVHSLSVPGSAGAESTDAIASGEEIFLANCAACHGEAARGSEDMGAPDLTDASWIFGGDLRTITATIHGGRQGHMPTWEGRLTDTEIRILALYVHSLGTAQP